MLVERNKDGTFKKDKRRKYNPAKQMVLDKPKHPVIRYVFRGDRTLVLDLRGIRDPHNPLNGILNPTQGMQRRWISPEHLQCMVNEYFESCNGPLFDAKGNLLKDSNGNIVKGQVRPYTVSGLALYLGVSTTTLKKYREGQIDTLLDELKAETEDRLTFSRVVLQAKQRIEAYAESRLYDRDGQRGAQFVLDCQFNWVDHQTRSNIKKAKNDTRIKAKEFELKRSLLEDGNNDGEVTINIVRKRPEE